jgi:glycosyltransferase involved in cell wall biosynthesis
MKLVLSVEALAPQLTGVGRYTWELAQRLQGESAVGSLQFYRNGRWIKEPSSLLAPGSDGRSSRISSLKWLRNIASKRACRGAIFHGPNFFLPPCVDIGVITLHDLSVFKFPETHPVARLRHYERDFARSMAQAAHLITGSETSRQEIISYFGWPEDKITTVYHGVSPDFMPRSASTAHDVLAKYGLVFDSYTLSVATIEPRKKIDRLLQAYLTFPLAFRHRYPLVLVGPMGWLSEGMHQKIAHYEKEGWLRYLGFIPEQDLPVLFSGARLFVYPSVYEGFGLPVIEAMASGVPVVTSDKSCLPEVSQGAASLTDPDDVEGFSSALELALEDENWRLEAVRRGLKTSSGYSWDRCVAETVTVYQGLLN